ncbi:hypothetical protein ACFYWN_20375 [Streptomyces sp. NPDC002917]|uniref:hypothetical protein n=1 Tax=Streptomyces sp. NPDC002917 TaxID=3364671 RepID=UPI0036ACB4D0
MSSVILVAVLMMALILGVTGLLAMVTGRIAFPWVRRGAKQPRVWGAGALLIAANLATAWLVPNFHGQSLVGMAGLGLICWAQGWRRRETPRAK